MSHYFARRFFQPQLISAEHTLSTGDINVIVSNDWTAPPLGTFNVTDCRGAAGVVFFNTNQLQGFVCRMVVWRNYQVLEWRVVGCRISEATHRCAHERFSLPQSASVLKFNLAAQQLDVARGFLAMEVIHRRSTTSPRSGF